MSNGGINFDESQISRKIDSNSKKEAEARRDVFEKSTVEKSVTGASVDRAEIHKSFTGTPHVYHRLERLHPGYKKGVLLMGKMASRIANDSECFSGIVFGSGTGYDSIRLADKLFKINPNGKIYGIDIDKDLCKIFSRQINENGLRGKVKAINKNILECENEELKFNGKWQHDFMVSTFAAGSHLNEVDMGTFFKTARKLVDGPLFMCDEFTYHYDTSLEGEELEKARKGALWKGHSNIIYQMLLERGITLAGLELEAAQSGLYQTHDFKISTKMFEKRACTNKYEVKQKLKTFPHCYHIIPVSDFDGFAGQEIAKNTKVGQAMLSFQREYVKKDERFITVYDALKEANDNWNKVSEEIYEALDQAQELNEDEQNEAYDAAKKIMRAYYNSNILNVKPKLPSIYYVPSRKEGNAEMRTNGLQGGIYVYELESK